MSQCLLRLAILNWNNDDAGRRFYHDIQQHLNETILPSLLLEAVNEEKVKRMASYLSIIEDMMFITPSSFSEEDKIALRNTIARVREVIPGLQSQNHAAELFGKGKNHHQEDPPNPGESNCCAIM